MQSNPWTLVIDNINIHEFIAQQRTDRQNFQFNRICGFIKKIIYPLLIQRDNFHPNRLDRQTNAILLEDLKDQEEYDKIVSIAIRLLVINQLTQASCKQERLRGY